MKQGTLALLAAFAMIAATPASSTADESIGSLPRSDNIGSLPLAGADIGVAEPELSAEALLELEAVAGSDVLVFIDSGAFSEVEWNNERVGFDVVKPITSSDWNRILTTYRRLATALGDQLWLVAPDRVGCQQTSLERLERYADDVRDLRELGARILVPVQKGELSQAEFAAAVDDVLGFSDWIPAMPCKKAATTAAELAAFVEARRPAHVHLLGLGIRSRDLDAYLAPFGDSTSVSLDSCWITGNVGRTNGPGKGPRRLTRARDMAKVVLERMRSTTVGAAELAVYACLAGAGLVR